MAWRARTYDAPLHELRLEAMREAILVASDQKARGPPQSFVGDERGERRAGEAHTGYEKDVEEDIDRGAHQGCPSQPSRLAVGEERPCISQYH